MKRIINIVVFGFCMLMLVQSCTKEMSEETIGLSGTAQGTLTDSLGNCKNSLVKGRYVIDTTLTDSNYVIANVNFTVTGKYKIFSDTVNGMWFLDSGYALATGPTTVKLKGRGTPLLPGSSDFVLTFGNSYCKFTVTTLGPNNGSSSLDYLPTTPNGYITYNLIGNFSGAINDTMRATISSSTFINSGKTFYKYLSTPYNSENYYAKESGTYYTIGTPEFEYIAIYDTIVYPAGGIQPTILYPYLKDNVSPTSSNASWTTDSLRVGLLNHSTGTYTYGWGRLKITILSTGGSANYLGTTYSNIIQLKREMQFKPDSGGSTASFTTFISAQLSYAKGIGLVDQVIDLGSGQTQSLTIKKFKGL
ncbi:MAG: hypothetical protein IKD55_12810 [Sediminibacterium sp.]|nr:hypothetical protein [Sediminibacterium sp.]MBX9779351.1 hypothetical protein [Chitinophagaceae bacterium]